MNYIIDVFDKRKKRIKREKQWLFGKAGFLMMLS
jgi:uncharacterized FlgJ-related protein